MKNIQPATQDFISIKDIKDSVVIKKNGEMCMILIASSINFALKSLDEQKAVLMQFQSFLNTLDFTLQFYVQSRRLNIEPYLDMLGTLHEKQDNDLMRTQLREYTEFIKSFTEDVNIMSKNFFVVIPFSPATVNLTKGLTSLFAPKPKAASSNLSDANFEEHRIQLEQRVGIVSEGLARVGVKTMPLHKDDLVELFYHTYNPGDLTGSAPLTED